jgi:hypothetical protein
MIELPSESRMIDIRHTGDSISLALNVTPCAARRAAAARQAEGVLVERAGARRIGDRIHRERDLLEHGRTVAAPGTRIQQFRRLAR